MHGEMSLNYIISAKEITFMPIENYTLKEISLQLLPHEMSSNYIINAKEISLHHAVRCLMIYRVMSIKQKRSL